MKNGSPAYLKIEREIVSVHKSGREGSVVQKSFTKVLAGCVSRNVYVGVLFVKIFLDPQKGGNEPTREWVMGYVLVFSEHQRDSFGGILFTSKKGIGESTKTGKAAAIESK